MKKRTLGSTGLELTELSYGASAIGNLYRAVSPQAAYDVLEASWQSGIRYFDTAPFYGHGLSERRLGDFLRDKADYVLSTKVGRILTPAKEGQIPDYGFVDPLPFDFYYDYTYEGIMRSYECSLARLGLNRIDILYVHDLEPRGFDDATYKKHLNDFLNGGQRALSDLKAQGAIRGFGLGVNQVSACLNVIPEADIDVILLAGRYTLLDRTAETRLLSECRTHGVNLVIGGVFNSGILAVGSIPGASFDYAPANADILERVTGMQTQLQHSGVALAQAALQFPLNCDLVTSVLIGSAKASSMLRNVDLITPQIDKAILDAVSDFTLRNTDE
jgi:D-threo-aldose 1-dehydrogenase